MIGLRPNVTTHKLIHFIGLKQPLQHKLDEVKTKSLIPLEPLTIVTDGVAGQQAVRFKTNIRIQDLDNLIGTTPSVQAQINMHNTSVDSLLVSVVTSSKVLNASSGYFYDHDAETIRMP